MLGEALIIATAVETVMAYFMIESFHRLAPLSPIMNVPAGLIAAVVTPLGLFMILLPTWCAAPIGWIISRMVHLLIAMPAISIRTPSAPIWVWIVYAAGIWILVWVIAVRRFRICCAAVLGITALQITLAYADFSPATEKDVVLTFLDVGQGDSIFIESPEGRRMLIDGGGVAAGRFLGLQDQSTFSIGEDVVSAYLFSRGIRRLDTVVLTHAHNDHMDGLSDVLVNFTVGELWLGRNPMIPNYRALIDLAQRRGIPLRFVSAGQQLREFTVLHPPQNWRVRKAADNNDSVVLLLRTGSLTALFTGDLELPLPRIDFVNLLKVAHHGSKGVRMRTKSNVRVISVGASNPFGHPHPSALPALRTDLMGAIEVRLEGSHPIVSEVLRR